MKPYGPSSKGSNRMNSIRKYGVGDMTEFRSDSEEAIVAAQTKEGSVLEESHAR